MLDTQISKIFLRLFVAVGKCDNEYKKYFNTQDRGRRNYIEILAHQFCTHVVFLSRCTTDLSPSRSCRYQKYASAYGSGEESYEIAEHGLKR